MGVGWGGEGRDRGEGRVWGGEVEGRNRVMGVRIGMGWTDGEVFEGGGGSWQGWVCASSGIEVRWYGASHREEVSGSVWWEVEMSVPCRAAHFNGIGIANMCMLGGVPR